MAQVILVARLLASALGLDFNNEWACWTDYVNRPAYICEYVQEGWFAEVWSNDGSHIYVNIDVE